MSFGTRLRERREALGLKQGELGKLLGITGSAIGNYENGISSPKADVLYQVFDVLKCDANYLFQDEMQELEIERFSVPEIGLIKKYRALDQYGQNTVNAVLDAELNRCTEQKQRPSHTVNLIPFLRSLQPVSAGTGAYLGPEEFETIFVEENELTRRASFGVPVRGDSMEPLYHDGDILVVEGAEDVNIGEIGVFTVNGDGYVKKRGDGVLISLNPDYAPIPITGDSWCNGKVIGLLAPEWVKE